MNYSDVENDNASIHKMEIISRFGLNGATIIVILLGSVIKIYKN